MKPSRTFVLLLLMLLCLRPAAAQRSPVQDLLTTARLALNDLRFAAADSILISVLSYDLRRSERIQALQLLAGALYPEERTAQRRDRAVLALRDLVRIAPSATLPREVSWAGLEDLLSEVRADTFGAAVTLRENNVLIGPDAAADIELVASQQARFLLRLTRQIGGNEVLADSLVGVARGTIPLRILADGVPRLSSGEYHLTILAIHDAKTDTIPIRFEASVQAPPIEYVSVPGPFDEARLLPEVTRPKRALAIVGGVLIAAGTIAASKAFRDSELGSRSGSDRRAITLGIVLGGGAAAGAWLLDRGEPIPANVAANRETRAEYERRIQEARTTNAQVLRTYRAVITINPEPAR